MYPFSLSCKSPLPTVFLEIIYFVPRMDPSPRQGTKQQAGNEGENCLHLFNGIRLRTVKTFQKGENGSGIEY